MKSKDEFLTVGEAARAAKLSPQWVRILVDTGRLPAQRGTLNERRISAAALHEFIERRQAAK